MTAAQAKTRESKRAKELLGTTPCGRSGGKGALHAGLLTGDLMNTRIPVKSRVGYSLTRGSTARPA